MEILKKIRTGAHKNLQDSKNKKFKESLNATVKEQDWISKYKINEIIPTPTWTRNMEHQVFGDKFLWKNMPEQMLMGKFIESSVVNGLKNPFTKQEASNVFEYLLDCYVRGTNDPYIEHNFGGTQDLIDLTLFGCKNFNEYFQHIQLGIKTLKQNFSEFLTHSEAINKHKLNNLTNIECDLLADKFIVEFKYTNQLKLKDLRQVIFYYLFFQEQISIDGVALFNCKTNKLYKIEIDPNIFKDLNWRQQITHPKYS